MPSGTQFDGGRELAILRQTSPLVGNLLTRLIEGLNRGLRYAGVSAAGELPAPPPVDSIAVKGTLLGNVLTTPGELLHFVHTHNVPLNRGIHYITEIDTSPNFPAPHQILDTTSRSGFVTLPTNTDSEASVVNYYLRVTAQYPGSKPSAPTVFGGLQGPTAINMSGGTSATLLPSQAGGTAKPGQGGQGLGALPARGPVGGPKRNLNP
jgi:hypothetical protein